MMTAEAPVLDVGTLRKIDLFLEGFYPRAVESGEQLAEEGLGNSQVRGLESLVNATTRFSEIISYIKNQAGKESEKKKKPWSSVAPGLLQQLEDLEAEAAKLGQNDPAAVLEVKLRLARGWARQVATHYFYRSSVQVAS